MKLITGIVYKIFLTSDPKIMYIGSTKNGINNRFSHHKSNYKTNRSPLKLKNAFDLYGIINFKIQIIKAYEVVDIRHLNVYETLWINKLRPILNKNSPFAVLVRKQYNQNNREHIKDIQKQYRKQYNFDHKEKFKNYYLIHKEHIKQYHQDNKEKLQAYYKNYYLTHKSQIIN